MSKKTKCVKKMILLFAFLFVIGTPSYSAVYDIRPDKSFRELIEVNDGIEYKGLLDDYRLYEAYNRNLFYNASNPLQAVVDSYGNSCYGQWHKDYIDNSWFFVVTDGIKVPKGFLTEGWYMIEWGEVFRKYHINEFCFMDTGWFRDSTGVYYLIADRSSYLYGVAATGIYNVNGINFKFDYTGRMRGQMSGFLPDFGEE